MDAHKLYQSLEFDFIRADLSDDWAKEIDSIEEFTCKNFKERYMGLVCDNTNTIKKVYTAVFPSEDVMKSIIEKNEEDIMLFVHHPAAWDIRRTPDVFQQMNQHLLRQFREKRISIYNLHVPLDNYGEYSTSTNLARALDIEIEEPFGKYFGGLCGIFGKTDLKTAEELNRRFKSAVGHNTRLYLYGDNHMKNGLVAVIGGGGNNIEFLNEIVGSGANTLVTGITALNDHSKKVHEFAKEHKINLLGGTHYSTEKFACIKMCEYFEKMGIPAEFIEDKPVLEDM